MSSQLGTGFLLFAARSTLTNRVTSFWKLHSPPQQVLNIELQNLLLGDSRGDWHVLRDTRTLFSFFIFLISVCLLTSEGLQHDYCCWYTLGQAALCQRDHVLVLHCEWHQGHSFRAERESISSSIFPVISLWPSHLSTQTSKSYYLSLPHQLGQSGCGRVQTPSRCPAECQTPNHNLRWFETAFYISSNFFCISTSFSEDKL